MYMSQEKTLLMNSKKKKYLKILLGNFSKGSVDFALYP